MKRAVTWLGHATVLVEVDGTRLLTDPVLAHRIGPLVRVAPHADPRHAEDVDAVLVSHLHFDHADLRTLRRLGRPVIAPAGAGGWLRRHRIADVSELACGEETTIGALRVRATPAQHDDRRHPLGPAADAVGYLISGSRSVYFAGDTDLFPAMADLSGLVDVALIPVAGWGPTLGPGHLDPQRAAEAAAMIAPELAIPIHWGTLALAHLARRIANRHEPAELFAAAAARVAPAVRVQVLDAGESAEL
jgi:L-ascorbate metabolism protein UlaG (beta-lactamase superfamily)